MYHVPRRAVLQKTKLERCYSTEMEAAFGWMSAVKQ
jgi:hypothetical protein